MSFVLLQLVQCKSKENESTPTLSEQKPCEYFKTGTFTLIDSTKNTNTTIVRTDSLQTETNHITGAVTKGSLNWVNPCTYELKYLESSSEMAVNIIGKTLVVQMVYINGESYTYTAKLKGSNYTSRNTISKIK